jgi:NADP-dependent 3-hydroxy acid dehydrogenase YdfG
VLGGLLARELAAAGADLALAGPRRRRLAALGEELGAPVAPLELTDPPPRGVRRGAAARSAPRRPRDRHGAVAFAPPRRPGRRHAGAVRRQHHRAIALIRAALPHLGEPGAVVALSAVVADHPTAGMAAYSASKAGLSAYLGALRREGRRRR